MLQDREVTVPISFDGLALDASGCYGNGHYVGILGSVSFSDTTTQTLSVPDGTRAFLGFSNGECRYSFDVNVTPTADVGIRMFNVPRSTILSRGLKTMLAKNNISGWTTFYWLS